MFVLKSQIANVLCVMGALKYVNNSYTLMSSYCKFELYVLSLILH